VFGLFADLLAFFYRLIPSYGMAIVLLTVAVRVVLFPLTAKQARSMQAMQRLQPELKRLQQKYRNDRQKLNEEMMKLYREHQVNPLAGCLPLLLQLPLFIVLYRVILGLTHVVIVGGMLVGGTFRGADLAGATLTKVRFSGQGAEIVDGVLHNAKVEARVVVDGREVGTLGTARVVHGQVTGADRGDAVEPVEVRSLDGKKKLGTVSGLRVEGRVRVEGDPRYIAHTTELYRALRHSGGEMVSWGVDLSKSALADHDGFAGALPYYVLVALVVATGYYQQRQMNVRNPQAAQNPQAQLMGKIFPVIFGYISLNIAAGVVVYFCVSNLWQIAQQALIFRQQAPAAGAAAPARTPAPKVSGDGQGTRSRPRPKKKGRK
jgi:YidC/Oxa1 family membrane protein insertase